MAKLQWLSLTCILFFSASADVQSKVTDNPADQLVVVLNNNRTANKLSSLYNNPGLACLALQYIKAYQGNCDEVGGPDAKKPADSEIAETFAPDCGVLVSSLAPFTGRLLGCQSKYVKPPEAFSELLIKNSKSLEILYNKNHTEVGAAVSGSDGGAPYFWCILFSDGKTNHSFSLEDGVAKVTRPGCFSGANDDCSSAHLRRRSNYFWACAVGIWVILGFVFGL
ncbi:hypothetical protein Nepgr_014238 [Nepenthes gracilis]|uniref:Ferredoxin-like protein n=1 Tax=Nepenthes gracilis TaxID=150966 RepID=A0AAD3SJN5_NEPGR|nr:hypothetical protein Nepgr_014238 [Nepenthes gracilis]